MIDVKNKAGLKEGKLNHLIDALRQTVERLLLSKYVVMNIDRFMVISVGSPVRQLREELLSWPQAPA